MIKEATEKLMEGFFTLRCRFFSMAFSNARGAPFFGSFGDEFNVDLLVGS